MNSQQTLEFLTSDEIAGFRLTRLELYNWGTFHDNVWSLNPEGRNVLVTGDIGSGKSTLIDAITTLLVPPARITYNKAAGAEKSERTLRTYVLGYYKSARNDSGLSSKPVALRDNNNYSVILGVFANEGFSQTISLAQVFSCSESAGQPERFYVLATQNLNINEHFANFGNDLRNLKKKLRTNCKATIFDSFASYSSEFKRYFGIAGDQALELFNQTVSMKSVGNLTGFVREHMLQEFDVNERIDRLLRHYDDLNRAHETVLKAKRQIEKLSVIADSCDKQEALSQRINGMRRNRERLRYFFALKKLEMLNLEDQSLNAEIKDISEKIESLKNKSGRLQSERDDLKQQIATNGGDRIERINSLIREKNKTKEKSQHKAAAYERLAQLAQLTSPDNLDSFLSNRHRIEEQLPICRKCEEDLQNKFTDQSVELRSLQLLQKTLSEEIDSLKKRRSNIPGAQISIRNALCQSLDIEEKQVPFVGELIQVRENEKIWEGTIERLLHNFALSLLVPDKLYSRIAEWVDQTDLRGRIVYFRVKEDSGGVTAELHRDSLVKKLDIKADSEFFCWLEKEIGRRFDYACCESIEQFRREHQAVTRNGQIKSVGQRHEKDDRHNIADRSRYVLGWSNEAKIKTLSNDLQRIKTKLSTKETSISTLRKEQIDNQNKKSTYEKLLVYEDFSDLDWKQIAREIADLEKERHQLEESSDKLKQLSIKLQEVEDRAAKNLEKLDAANSTRSKTEEKLNTNKQKIEDATAIIDTLPTDARIEICEHLEPLCQEVKPGEPLTLRNCDSFESVLREHLQNRIDSDTRRLKDIEEKIVQLMQDFRRDYPIETQEYDARVEAAGEYREMLRKLVEDSLPSYELRFKSLLNENTIIEIANFNNQLNLECQNIKERIAKINDSLAQIEYNPGRFIKLEDQTAPDADIRDFKQELRACTEGALNGTNDEQYDENKFLRVKTIIERFRGREGLTDADLRWKRKVTDVRNWFIFAASERRKEDDSEYEHYTDSGGKSGGQKEKLAYTILAASLAYQFGLERGEVRSRSFRFVVIDEAFGRGSEESTRYGLELFKQLNLQLLVVTPLQKIHIIEPYVESVGFVYGNDDRESMLRNLTISEYRKEREARAK